MNVIEISSYLHMMSSILYSLKGFCHFNNVLSADFVCTSYFERKSTSDYKVSLLIIDLCLNESCLGLDYSEHV
jgi:hypothetical protein